MADDKQGRDKQAHDQERRQRERELSEARERADEAEPITDTDLELEAVLADYEYPATSVELVDAFGNREIEARSDSYTLEELLGSDDEETYDSPAEAREHLQEILDRY